MGDCCKQTVKEDVYLVAVTYHHVVAAAAPAASCMKLRVAGGGVWMCGESEMSGHLNICSGISCPHYPPSWGQVHQLRATATGHGPSMTSPRPEQS